MFITKYRSIANGLPLLARLCLGAFCVAVSMGKEVEFSVLVAAEPAIIDTLQRIPVRSWRAQLVDLGGIDIVSLQRVDARIDQQTVIIVDLVNTQPLRHPAILQEAIAASRGCSSVDLTFIVIGDSPELLTQFSIAGSRSIGIHHTLKTSPSHPPSCLAVLRGRREWHWVQKPQDPFVSFPYWFSKSKGPIRVFWLAERFEWFGDGLVCEPGSGYCAHKNPAFGSLGRFVRMAVAMFPVLPADDALPESARRQRRACAKYFAEYLGGIVLDTKQDLGRGHALSSALDATAGGLLVTLRSPFGYGPFDIVLRVPSQRKPLMRRSLYLSQGQYVVSPLLPPVDLIVDLLPSQPLEHLVLLAGGSGPNERIQVDLPVPASPASVVHVVLASSGGVDEKPLLSRFTLRGEELIRLGEALRVSVPIPTAHPRVRRVSVFEEQTKWAGYYVASP
jgi:hypothetical protein